MFSDISDESILSRMAQVEQLDFSNATPQEDDLQTLLMKLYTRKFAVYVKEPNSDWKQDDKLVKPTSISYQDEVLLFQGDDRLDMGDPKMKQYYIEGRTGTAIKYTNKGQSSIRVYEQE